MNCSPIEPIQIHLLIGPPASGKSQLATLLAPKIPARVISTDSLRRKLWGDESIQGPWPEIQRQLHDAIHCASAEGESLLLDATHARREWRRNLIEESSLPSSITWFGWWLHTPLQQCLRWNRARHRQVPEPLICTMHRMLSSEHSPCCASEGFKHVFAIDPVSNSPLEHQLKQALAIVHHGNIHEER